MKSFFHLILIIVCFAIMSGCGGNNEDIEELEPAPEVLSVCVADSWELPSKVGWAVPGNASISVVFSKEMDADSVQISLNCIPVSATSSDGVVFTFMPEAEGEYELTIIGEDISGHALEPPYESIRFKVVEPDTTPPDILDDECRPRNGEEDVDAATCTKPTIVFSEPMAEVEVIATDPWFMLTDKGSSCKLSADGRILEIVFGMHRPANETRYSFQLSGRDLAGNELVRSEYSFTTISSEKVWSLWVMEHTLIVSADEVIMLEPFQEITFSFRPDVKLDEPVVLVDVRDIALSANQVAINGHTGSPPNGEWIPGLLLTYIDGDWNIGKDDHWHTELVRFQPEHVNLNGDNILTITAGADAMQIRNITVSTWIIFGDRPL